MAEPVLRAAGPADDEGIRGLFAACFPDSPKADAAVLAWQYWDNPFAPVRSWVWEDDGEIVSHYAGLPVPLQLGDERGVAAIGVDAATAPSHRGKGLFEAIARAVYDDCGRHGMPVTLCFPNPNSLRGFVKAGGAPVGQLRTFVAPLDDEWVARRFKVPRAVAGAVRRVAFPSHARNGASEVFAPPPDVDDLWAATGGTAHGIARDAAWWRWRYEQHPHGLYRYFEARRHGRLVAAAATTVRDDFGGRFVYLLELLAEDRDAGRAVVGAVAAAAGDASGVAFATLDGTAPARTARAAGLRPLPRRLEPKPLHFGIADNCGDRADLVTVSWSLAWGDLDHL
jgi:predicted N-acetyltransferase YhbS